MKHFSVIKRITLVLTGVSFLAFCGTNSQSDDSSAIAFLLLAQQNSQIDATNPCRPRTAIDQAGVYNAKQIVSAPANTGSGFQDSYCAVDGVMGLGDFNGSLDVFTLDTSGAGASLILGWDGKKVQDTAGSDFIVFENPFLLNGNPSTVFVEPVIVEVGNNQTDWCGWNPTYTGGGTYSNDPADWIRFAGINYVDYNQITNPMDSATLFATGGGDAFDLSDADFGNSGNGCNAALKNELQTNGFLFVKMTGAKEIQTALPIPGANENPDIDGVIAKQLSP
ncbi:LIC_13355 family lipoprotein [Leptospira ellisii]|uniref:LIC_13355 family lipoprotein n=1 Tax=Leptospira ellisii TaxID=2023197 RepID=A0A2N0BCH1_9LEPT|nr:LIC_13355 family lipoprotein [Leptospira ellisii]MDV6237646.1 LIC_13355 family lipoprotein [Leptospira ellisii]PJZ94236.1 hypothetical protein CH379_03590 [Leptospira ellisii]PKA04740.1 hypothetical protein CH375_09145 [Leptospira ellisii]